MGPLSATKLLHQARVSSAAAIALADDVALLMGWLRHDILAVAGPCYADRRELYDFVVAELKSRAAAVSPSDRASLPTFGEPA